MLIILTALLYGSASVHSTSKDFLKALKRSRKKILKKNDAKWMKMQLELLKAFGIKVGMLNYIKKASLFMVYGVWLNYCAGHISLVQAKNKFLKIDPFLYM